MIAFPLWLTTVACVLRAGHGGASDQDAPTPTWRGLPRTDSEAFVRGRDACLGGLGRTACPYRQRAERALWLEGWDEAERDFERSGGSGRTASPNVIGQPKVLLN